MALSPGAKAQPNLSALAFAGRIQSGLQFDVERARTNATPVHRTQHLEIPNGIEAEAAWDAGFYQLDDTGNCGFRIIRLNKIEVTLALWSTLVAVKIMRIP